MKKVKRYRQGDVVDVAPDDSGGGGGGAGVSYGGGSFELSPRGGITLPNDDGGMPEGAFTSADQRRLNEMVAAERNSIPLTQRMADVSQAQNGLGMKDNEIYSRIRGLGPGLAASRLEKAGVDVPGLIGNRTGSGFDAGPGFKKGGAVKKMAKGGSTSSASKRADGCAQRGKTKGRFV
jgi:hypothetical protein